MLKFILNGKEGRLIFKYHNCSKKKKAKLIIVEFANYVLVWWDQLFLAKHRNQEQPLATWEEMKRIMKKQFSPSYYYHELYQVVKINTRFLSIEDYHKKMEIAMMRANIEEDQEVTMA